MDVSDTKPAFTVYNIGIYYITVFKSLVNIVVLIHNTIKQI